VTSAHQTSRLSTLSCSSCNECNFALRVCNIVRRHSWGPPPCGCACRVRFVLIASPASTPPRIRSPHTAASHPRPAALHRRPTQPGRGSSTARTGSLRWVIPRPTRPLHPLDCPRVGRASHPGHVMGSPSLSGYGNRALTPPLQHTDINVASIPSNLPMGRPGTWSKP
jgi:hypothetical protein